MQVRLLLVTIFGLCLNCGTGQDAEKDFDETLDELLKVNDLSAE